MEWLGGSVGLHPEGVAMIPGLVLPPHAAVRLAVYSPGLATEFVDFFLAGPRAVLLGLSQLRITRRLQHVSRQPAAEALLRLAGRSEGMEARQLLQEGQTLADLQGVLSYLVFYEWIGVGDQWRRVWLWSSVRPTLQATRVGPVSRPAP